eukprot:2439697-Alexandrium_andersonii.AAC.1
MRTLQLEDTCPRPARRATGTQGALRECSRHAPNTQVLDTQPDTHVLSICVLGAQRTCAEHAG